MLARKQSDELYTKIYDAYADSILKDEYVRSTLGDTLDYLIKLQSMGAVTADRLTTTS